MPTSLMIVYSAHATKDEKFAAKEIRRYLYLRTSVLLPMVAGDSFPEGAGGVIVAYPDRKLIRDSNVLPEISQESRREQSYCLKTLPIANGKWIVATGGREGGLLYAVYRLVEHFGVRFSLHGDIIPDQQVPLVLPDIYEIGTPLFQLRGILPFHDFPEGPDWWNENDYKSVLSQLPKLRMNFIGLHTYPERPRTNLYASAEPTVWIGLPENVKENGDVIHSYPARHFATVNGAWGYASQATGSYTDGGDQLFERDDYGAEYMQGMAPWPDSMEASNELFNRFGHLLKSVFTYANELGISTCIGIEGPITIPQEVKLHLIEKGIEDRETIQLLYEGIFTRIKKNLHPLDYFWIWTPETWTWGGNTEEQTYATLRDIEAAISAAEKVSPSIQVATSGWVLGPQSDRTLFDRHLPKSVPFSCINRNLGFEFVEPSFRTIQNRPGWAIPWVEDDPAMILPQLWAGRMRMDAADALAYGCDGLMGIHWRTKVVDPTVAALASAGWDQTSWNPNLGEMEEENLYSTEGAKGGRSVKIQEGAGERDEIYASARVGMEGYRIQVPNGTYRVKLKFLEWEFVDPGKRVFDVITSGGIDKRLYQLDIYAGSGRNQAWERSIEEVKVSDGFMDLTFKSHNGEACVSAIVIDGQTDDINQFKGYAYTRKINCGGLTTGDYEADLPALRVRDRDLPIADFYLDWVMAQFGPAVAEEVAGVFTEIDGKLPRPATWVTGPGSTIVANRASWEDTSLQYAFLDRFEALRDRVQGTGHLDRYDYWLHQFRFLRSAAQIGCLLGMYDIAMETVKAESSAEHKRVMAKEQLLPIYKELVIRYAELNQHLLNTVSTPGELGTFSNVQQQTMESQLLQPGQELEALLGEPLPQDALPSHVYRGKPRLIVPTVRTSLDDGESLNLKVLMLGQGAANVSLYWRTFGEGPYRQVPCTHMNRGVYQVTLQSETSEDFEYYIEAIPGSGEVLRFPVTAPTLNQTIVIK